LPGITKPILPLPGGRRRRRASVPPPTESDPAVDRLKKQIDYGVRALAAVSGAGIVAMMLLTCADVFLRYLFNAPIEGTLDVTQMLMVIVVFFGLAYCGWTGGHVVVDLLREFLPAGILVPLAVLVNATGAVAMLAMAWQSVETSFTYMITGETPMTVLIPKYPFIWVAAFGALSYAAILIFKTVRPDERDDSSGSRP
jgi:TRAP-type C4-dicarboxylate transport system permease small subunit